MRFREKPNVDLAESFIRKGNFRWNAGMFVWTVPTILTEFNRHAPEFGRFIAMMSGPGLSRKTGAKNSRSFRERLSITP